MEYKIKQTEPYVGWREKRYLKDCINRKWLTEGKYAEKLLYLMKQFTGAEHMVFAPNGTLGIYLGLLAIGIKPGDEVIVPDFTFNASASPLHFIGAKPVFVDIFRDTLQIDVMKVEEAVKKHPKVKAIMPVHIYGVSANMVEIKRIAREHNLKVIEDAAQGIGVKWYDHGVNSHVGTIGDVGIISMFSDKTICMGEGAVVLTNNIDIYRNLKYIRNQGRLESGMFEHERLGMNLRVTDLQCAVGYAQMKKIWKIIIHKQELARCYCDELAGTYEKVWRMEISDRSNFIPFRFPIQVNNKEVVMKHLEANGVQTRGFFYPLHRQPCWKHLKYKKNDFPESNKAYDEGICLPIHMGITKQDVKYICDKIKEVL